MIQPGDKFYLEHTPTSYSFSADPIRIPATIYDLGQDRVKKLCLVERL